VRALLITIRHVTLAALAISLPSFTACDSESTTSTDGGAGNAGEEQGGSSGEGGSNSGGVSGSTGGRGGTASGGGGTNGGSAGDAGATGEGGSSGDAGATGEGGSGGEGGSAGDAGSAGEGGNAGSGLGGSGGSGGGGRGGAGNGGGGGMTFEPPSGGPGPCGCREGWVCFKTSSGVGAVVDMCTPRPSGCTALSCDCFSDTPCPNATHTCSDTSALANPSGGILECSRS
jgi:hypothetical protein